MRAYIETLDIKPQYFMAPPVVTDLKVNRNKMDDNLQNGLEDADKATGCAS